MWKLLASLFFVFVVGCASQPMTPEEAAQWRNAGRALSGWSNQMQQRQRQVDMGCLSQCISAGYMQGFCQSKCSY